MTTTIQAPSLQLRITGRRSEALPDRLTVEGESWDIELRQRKGSPAFSGGEE